jgi:hypothetical protein
MFRPNAGSSAIRASLPVFLFCAPNRLCSKVTFQLVSFAAAAPGRQECLCHILLMPSGKPAIISQAEQLR